MVSLMYVTKSGELLGISQRFLIQDQDHKNHMTFGEHEISE